MVKLLRKYNKYVLVGGVSLLMIAFLIPQGIQQFSDPSRRTFAHLGGEKITMKAFNKAQAEFNAVKRFSPALIENVLGVENPEHWLLITKQAERGGFVGDAGDGTDWPVIESITVRIVAAELAEQQYPGFAQFAMQQPQLANPILQRAVERTREILPLMKIDAMNKLGLSEPDFNRAVAKARGVYRMIEAFRGAARYSDRRAVLDKKEQLDAVFADCAIVPAERAGSAAAEPTEAELAAHFEKYRVVKAGAGDNGIGYTLPPRVKIEWITLERDAYERAIKIDAVDSNKRWRTNRAKYPGEFGAEKENVERDLRAEKVTEVMDAADRTVRSELKKTAGKLETHGGHKVLPADWASQRPKLEAIAQLVVEGVKASSGVEIPIPPVTVKAAGWLTQPDIAALGDIANATVRSGSKVVPFPQIVFFVNELRSAGSPGADFGLQVGLTSSDIFAVDDAGRRYYFTVLDVRPESPAETLDEVRTQAIIDIKKLRAYDLLLAKADVFAEAAVLGGIDAVSKAVDEQFPRAADAPALPESAAVKTIKNAVFLKEDVVNADPRLNTKELREAVSAAATKLDPAKPGTDTAPTDRTFSQGLPHSLSLGVVQLVQNRPMTAEMNRRAGEQTILQLREVEFRGAMAKLTGGVAPFSLKELTAVLDYKPERDTDDPDAETPPQDGDTTKTGEGG